MGCATRRNIYFTASPELEKAAEAALLDHIGWHSNLCFALAQYSQAEHGQAEHRQKPSAPTLLDWLAADDNGFDKVLRQLRRSAYWSQWKIDALMIKYKVMQDAAFSLVKQSMSNDHACVHLLQTMFWAAQSAYMNDLIYLNNDLLSKRPKFGRLMVK